MEEKITYALNALKNAVSSIDLVKSIGISGTLLPYPEPGKGDFDIFVYCAEIPEEEIRIDAISSIDGIENIKNIGSGKSWGYIDYCSIMGIDTCVMYFKTDDVIADNNEILEGKFLWKTDNYFFPVGRLSMFSNINILYDEERFLEKVKESLRDYPEPLKIKMINFHTKKMFNEEDFGRAVNRKDIFFYHSVLDTAIEHFLMALFALNETYFPSRKRTKEYINKFHLKPKACSERLIQIIEDSVIEDRIKESYDDFRMLCIELSELT